ncbi:MAG: 8-oxoguanine deaminase [Clostridiaceae bacterium]|nr:8-oxoguanine deaminase [Clostridiaceae bacterium]
MATLLIKNVKQLISCDAEDKLYDSVNIFCEDGLIRDISKETHEADETIDATDMLCFPGFINTHHHLYQIFTRNLPQTQNKELFEWLRINYEIWKRLDEDTVYLSSKTGMAELMKNGCTTVSDHHYVFPKDSGDLIGAQIAAADELGIRTHFTRGSMDLSVKDGGLPPDSVVQTVYEILRDSAVLVEKYHDKSFGAMHRLALAPCSPFSVSDTLLRESAKLARELGVRLHTHLAETRDEEDYTLQHFGMRPLEYMESLGWVGKDVWYAHGIHFNSEELQLLADTGTGVCHCPTSNLSLSSGVARIPEMMALDIPVGLGVDGCAANNGMSLLEEIRTGYLMHRLNSPDNGVKGYDMLKLATMGGARVLGREQEIGSVEVGKCADIILLSVNRLDLVGAFYDPMSILATVGIKGYVDYTIINGEITVRDGKLVNLDEENLIAEANQEVREFLQI